MVKADGFEVYVVRHEDQYRYPEYKAPVGSRHYKADSHEVFIEAEDGVRFDLVAEFYGKPRGKSPHVSSFCSLDGNEESGFYTATTKSGANEVAAWKTRRVWDEDARYVDGKWINCGFTFSGLELDEDADPDDDDVAREVDDRGSIRFRFTRGMVTKSKTPEAVDGAKFAPQYSGSACKAVVKKEQVSHALEHVELSPAEEPIDDVDFTATRGSSGRPVVFTIRYRSRPALQLLKIIPEDEETGSNIPVNLSPTHSCPAPVVEPPATPVSQESRVPTNRTMPKLESKIDGSAPDLQDEDIQFVSCRTSDTRKVNPATGQNAIKLEKQAISADQPKVKRERSEVAPNLASATPAETTSKQRKRAKLQLELEAIRLQQRIAALDDSD